MVAPYRHGSIIRLILKAHWNEELDRDDWRRNAPRFQGANLGRNLQLAEKVRALAAERGSTPGQLALAWGLAQAADVVPIPGTKRRTYLEENVRAVEIELTEDDLRRIEEFAPRGAAAGARYPEAMMHLVGR